MFLALYRRLGIAGAQDHDAYPTRLWPLYRAEFRAGEYDKP